MKSAIDRFNEKWSADDNGCWIWQASRTANGYGVFTLGSERFAHRASYLLHVGAIPAGLDLDHLCRVRNCVNPEHLEPVTHAENIRRGAWAMKTHCPQGHEYTPENTYICVRGEMRSRQCRECTRIRKLRNYHEKKALLPERSEGGWE